MVTGYAGGTASQKITNIHLYRKCRSKGEAAIFVADSTLGYAIKSDHELFDAATTWDTFWTLDLWTNFDFLS